MPSRTPSTAALERFHHATMRVMRAMREVDESGPLSAARASALSVLVLRGPQPLGTLARAEAVKPPTMSRLVKEMRIDGLVELLATGADRREVRVAASPRGRRLLMEARTRRICALARLFRGATPRESAALDAVAQLVGRGLAQAESSARPAERAKTLRAKRRVRTGPGVRVRRRQHSADIS